MSKPRTAIPTMRPFRKFPPTSSPQHSPTFANHTPPDAQSQSPSSELPLTPSSRLQSPPRPSLRSTPRDQLDTLTDAQLTHLTRSNTRRNLGTRRSRLRSQLERVCRKLDNLTLDGRLSRRPSLLQPVPVVSPDHHQPVDSLTSLETPDTHTPKHELDIPVDEDCFAIEPATPHDVFSEKSSRASVLTEGDNSSRGRSNADSSNPATQKSVRISTSVTFLDYSPERRNQSVSTGTRLKHPTCNDRSSMLRRALTETDGFPRAKLHMGADDCKQNTEAELSLLGEDEQRKADTARWVVTIDSRRKRRPVVEAQKLGSVGTLGGYKVVGGGGVRNATGVPFVVPLAGGAYAERPKLRGGDGKVEAVTSVGSSCTPTSTTTPKAAYVVPTSNGACERKVSSGLSE